MGFYSKRHWDMFREVKDTPEAIAWRKVENEILAQVRREIAERFEAFKGLEGDALFEKAKECAEWAEARVLELRRERGTEVRHGTA